MGDPAGVGPEVLLFALAHHKGRALDGSACHITVVGDVGWLERLGRQLHLTIPWDRIRWVDVKNLPAKFTRGKVQPLAGRAAFEYLEVALARLKEDPLQALVTAPVSKEAVVRAGIPWGGHTEYLGRAFRAQPVMMFVTGRFRAALVTTHLALRDLSSQITKVKVVRAIRMMQESLVRDFGIRHPRIGLAALNPHAGEGTLFGLEEQRVLKPAIRSFDRFRMNGCAVQGPIPADHLMRLAAVGQYDGVVALYHDQALIAVKLLGWEKAVNVTLGLPFVRTSPVHGTAFDLVDRGRAHAGSMRAAIDLAVELSRRRHRASY